MESRVIVEIHPQDDYYPHREYYIGKVGQFDKGSKIWKQTGSSEVWEEGMFRIEGSPHYFDGVKTIQASEEQMERREAKERITPYGNLYKRKLRLRTSRT